ncbi:helix-turn-helix domain-containing protein [Kitasatospora sp. NPDC005748]|uniref:helix-turn-helix domain-containing protein n=1 Tax=Kitasatospora sp. NPDC005748 TaxID=3157063 RepID=UPI0033DC9195
MGEIDEGLERAERTRPIPRSTAARTRFLLRGAKGSTKRLAQELGVSQRTVQRWLKLAVALSILVIVSSSLPTRSGDLLVGRA